MPTIRVLRPTNFEQYVAAIGETNSTNGNLSWFRGVNDARHRLIPGLYRHRQTRTTPEWSKLEQQMMLSFAQRSMPFVERPIASLEGMSDGDWSTLFYMQHYKIPTRLLDWSQNPFVALFFAAGGKFTATQVASTRSLTFADDAAIWILNPAKWNRTAWNHLSWDDGIAFTNEKNLTSYRPPISGRSSLDLPIAMFGSHNSRRIVAQRGAFTIFGASTLAMDEHYETNHLFSDELVKVVIDKTHLPEIRKALFSYGFTDSVIYPDLEGLAHEIKRDFGFED